jgi:hypothetical protein
MRRARQSRTPVWLRSIQTSATSRTGTFNPAEKRALRALRSRYHQDFDLFSRRERALLLFLHWLYQTEQLTEIPCCPPEASKEAPMVTR